MIQQKLRPFLFIVLAIGLMVIACGQQQPDAEDVAVSIALTQTAAAAEVSGALGETQPSATPVGEAEPNGLISGRAHLQAPPTPPLILYAVDNASGAWAFTETQQADGAAPFTLQVPAGTYQVFACLADAVGCGLGYSEDGWTLSEIKVTAGETVADINVRPPSMSECGPTFGFPASPDGRFTAVAGPSAECKAAAMAAMQGDLQPMALEECADLAAAAEQNLGILVTVTNVPIQNSWSGQTGSGCQLLGLGDGNNFDSAMGAATTLGEMLLNRGWVEEIRMPMCLGQGGMGPAAANACYVQSDQICEVFTHVDPVDMALCEGIDGPIGECLAVLQPEQRRFTVQLTCAQGFNAPQTEDAETEPIRVEFAAGETSTQELGALAPGEVDRYVLTAMQDQQLNVYLYPSGKASLAVLGSDGSPITADYVDDVNWIVTLPVSQDYFIEVKSLDENAIDYALDIVIPPLSEGTGASGKICFPSETIPAMTAYFEDTVNGVITELAIAEGQSSYEVNLEPGTYLAYAWLPDFSLGGLFSNAVPCGLTTSCTDHSAIVFQVNPDQITTGIDICDWYVGPFDVPSPEGQETTGAISGLIAYPEDYVPPLHIVAYNQDTGFWYWIGTTENTYQYTIDGLLPGRYHVVAYTQNDLVGGHASGDGALVIINVKAGETTTDADITVWLARDNPYFPADEDPGEW